MRGRKAKQRRRDQRQDLDQTQRLLAAFDVLNDLVEDRGDAELTAAWDAFVEAFSNWRVDS